MELWAPLWSGLEQALTPGYLLACVVGALVGTLIGVLPGIGPVGAIALLLPFSLRMDPTGALILIAGIYYGSMYGGSTTSILMGIPGEVASVVTVIDGYQMARKGRAGPALAISALGSFVGGTFSVLGLMALAPLLVPVALSFGPPEYFSLMLVSLVLIVILSSESPAKGLVAGMFGLVLSQVGMDGMSGMPRFTFGLAHLWTDIDIVPIAVGLFAIPEILESLEESATAVFAKLERVYASKRDLQDSAGPVVRGSLVGFLAGILPGAGPVLASFLSYALEKLISKDPGKFGKGAIEGVAGPETANNAATGGALVPLFALGLPCNPVIALILAVLIVHGLQPGPLFMQQQGQLFWTFVASMYVGNAILLVLNLPLIGIWVRLLKVPYPILLPFILMACILGTYSANSSVFDLFLMILFGVIGYGMRKTRFPASPVILAFIVGRTLETSLRQSLILSGGSPLIFFARPISLALILGAALLAVLLYLMLARQMRRPAPEDDGVEAEPHAAWDHTSEMSSR